MNDFCEPFADERLTSWCARRSHLRSLPNIPEPRAVWTCNSTWRHPDVNPTQGWLRTAARAARVTESALASHSIARRYPRFGSEDLAWETPPRPLVPDELGSTPRLQEAWCSRCLAEDFDQGRSASFRQHWAFSVTSFCHRHTWPLETRCNSCHSSRWRFTRPPRGPLRLICEECLRPLERASSLNLRANANTQRCWARIVAFEQQLLGAVAGKVPDQFRFNFTSPAQLLNQVRDIGSLLMHRPLGDRDWWSRTTNIGLNDFDWAVTRLPAPRRGFWSCDDDNPLKTAYPTLRRALLATMCAMLEDDPSAATDIFGPQAKSGLEMLLNCVPSLLLDEFLAMPARWSPSFVGRINQLRDRHARNTAMRRHKERTEALNAYLGRRSASSTPRSSGHHALAN